MARFRIHDRSKLVEIVRYMGVSAASSQPSEPSFHLVTAWKP